MNMKPDTAKQSGSSIGDMFGAATTSTFLGLPEATIENGARAAIAILGAPAATPYPSVGAYCAGGPAAIRAGIANWAAARDHMDFDLGGPMLPPGVTAGDCGDLPFDLGGSAPNRPRITAAVAARLAGGARPGVLGGPGS